MGLFEAAGGGNQNVTQTTTVNPWGPQGTALTKIYNQAGGLYDNQKAQGPLAFSSESTDALNSMEALARSVDPTMRSAVGSVNQAAAGHFDANPNMFGSIYGQTQGPGSLSQGWFGDTGRGEMLGYPGAGQPGKYDGSFSGGPSGGPGFSSPEMIGSNPYRQAALDDSLRRTKDNLKSTFSAKGRYGSDDMMERGADELGGIAANFNLNAYNSDQDRAMQAAQAMSQENLARQQMGLSAASGTQGALGQNAQIRMQAAGMAPAMSDYRYAGARALAGVGAAKEQKSQEGRDYLGGLLRDYKGIVGDVPGAAGQSQTSQPKPSWLQTLLGGGLGLAGGIAGLFG